MGPTSLALEIFHLAQGLAEAKTDKGLVIIEHVRTVEIAVTENSACLRDAAKFEGNVCFNKSDAGSIDGALIDTRNT